MKARDQSETRTCEIWHACSVCILGAAQEHERLLLVLLPNMLGIEAAVTFLINRSSDNDVLTGCTVRKMLWLACKTRDVLPVDEEPITKEEGQGTTKQYRKTLRTSPKHT
jgi:hypothetical protein